MHDNGGAADADRMQRENPFAAPIATDATTPSPHGMPDPANARSISRLRLAVSGALWTMLLSIPVAALLGVIFRFPVPFVGYMSGPSAAVPAMFAVLFYGLALGGFVWLGLLGSAIAVLIPDALRNDQRKVVWLVRVWAAGVTTANLMVLSILDMIIGPF